MAENQTLSPFSSAFKVIVAGQTELGTIADKGASYSLLTIGMATLIASIAIKIASIFGGAVIGNVSFSTGDLAILVAGSTTLLIVGGGLRIVDRYFQDKAAEREKRFTLDAAEKATIAAEKAEQRADDAAKRQINALTKAAETAAEKADRAVQKASDVVTLAAQMEAIKPLTTPI